MRRFRVTLEQSLHGSAVGSTEDVFDAETAADAERQAIGEWVKIDPRYIYRPLLTTEEPADAPLDPPNA